MTRIYNILWTLRIWKDIRGQDLVEYALMVGFMTVAAGVVMPGFSTSVNTFFSRVSSTLASATFSGS